MPKDIACQFKTAIESYNDFKDEQQCLCQYCYYIFTVIILLIIFFIRTIHIFPIFHVFSNISINLTFFSRILRNFSYYKKKISVFS